MGDDETVPPDHDLPPDDRPEAAVSERSLSLMNEAMFTVDLQVRRARGREPEDDAFVMRWWADLQFLIVASVDTSKPAIRSTGQNRPSGGASETGEFYLAASS